MKNLIKTAVIAATVAFSASLYADSYIYWMMDGGATGDFSYTAGDWTVAKVKAYNPNVEGAVTTAPFLTIGGGTGTDYQPTLDDGSFYEQYATLGANAENMAYVIELWNSEGGVARSQAFTYNDLVVVTGMAGGVTEFNFGSGAGGFYAIPEPTSGLLLLLGIGALALRRKQKIA